MKSITDSTGSRSRTFALLLLFIALVVALPGRGMAQTGKNAVYQPSPSQATIPSQSFWDASMLIYGSNICTTLYQLLQNSVNGSPGAVIDARGLPGNTGISMTCSGSGTPWYQSSGGSISIASTILLPSAPITIESPWVLPSGTHLIGEGDGLPSNGASSGTTIQVDNNFPTGQAMIQFGGSTGCCTSISVENLVLNGQGNSVGGILNQYSQDQSFVDHIGLYQILGTGLVVTGSAQNSGPYTNIVFDTNGESTPSTVCAQIINVTGGTHGIHGLRCKGGSVYAPAAVLLDSSGNSLEDITVIGFYDGVRIGSDSNAKEDVLINVIGDTTAHIQAPTPVNAIHIYNSNTVHDIVIKGVSNSQQNGTYTIQDDQTSLHLSDAFIAMYVAGKEIGPGYVRFTTSPNAPTWAVGNNFPTNNPTGNACTRGSLYSCIGGTSSCQSKALWGCALNSGGTLQWIPIM